MVGPYSVADLRVVVPEICLSDSLGCMSCNMATQALFRVLVVLRTTSVVPRWSLAVVVLLYTTLVVLGWFLSGSLGCV